MFDLLESVKVIIWQALVPSPSGKRIALREYLLVTPDVRDALIGCKPRQLIARVRQLLPSHGQSIAKAAQKKYQQGLISESVYRRFVYIEEVEHEQ